MFSFVQPVFQLKWIISFAVKPGRGNLALYSQGGSIIELEAHPPLWLVWLQDTSITLTEEASVSCHKLSSKIES